MSLSKAERRLPQYCYCHPRKSFRSFQAHEGRFVDNKRRFVCHECFKRINKQCVQSEQRQPSPVETRVCQAFQAANIQYIQQFRVGKFYYDFAIPTQRLLIEIDSYYYHRFRISIQRDHKKDNVAKEAGWRLIRLRKSRDIGVQAVKVVKECRAEEKL